nr:hypothetical protein [Tanacetum cinerariifolium]
VAFRTFVLVLRLLIVLNSSLAKGIFYCVPYGGKHGCFDEEIEFCEDGVDEFKKEDYWERLLSATITLYFKVEDPILKEQQVVSELGKFEQWQFRIQQYIQHEHYALWEVIEFRDSYVALKEGAATDSTGEGTATKKGRTVTITTEDMQKRRNDTAQELWAAILKTFGGNEATKKKKKNLLKPQYGNFKAEGSETSEQTFNRLQIIVSQLEFIDIEIEQDDLNQKDGHQMEHGSSKHEGRQILEEDWEEDNHLRAPKIQDRGRIDNYRQGSKVEEQAPKALMAIDEVGWDWSYMENEQEDHALTGLPEFTDDIITDYTMPSPSVESNPNDLQNRFSFASENGESTGSILSRPEIKFMRPADSTTIVKTDKKETVRKTTVKYVELYTKTSKKSNDSGCSWHMTGNISYLFDYEPYDGGYVSFEQGGCKITGKGTIKTGKLEFENVYFVKDLKTPRQHNMYSIDLNNVVPHKDLTCLVDKASADKCMLWHRRLGKQHKASCKTKLVNSMTKPLHTLHMYLFGPTSDETSGILRNFITEIENLKELRVKIIRCDNGGEFRNKEMNDFYSRKGIKKEFNNARTPQQNGVAERRNKTLIEAARTVLADAKLPVTIWAKVVNTVCYVQNRFLVNKSQNKTPYELFNGRTPAIRFLKPFGCHVMILNTLDNLGKFEAKGDEDYFIGYSMSSKAFRVFNKRTNIVEENLHVDFLENKPIEKRAGLNCLFDIYYLTNSMNYFPVVVARTNSTNFSGTKKAAGQDVKKDVSSLRYIVLPNWFHETHLETSTSNAQDACNADAPESSGNFNPTATSINPSANHMETLAVETPIPTVSSPVPTSCLNDPPEPSSDTRLISKRVTSQDDTPSLDNILTLTNRFGDILRVTTNTDDINGVEADLGNIETTIIASPNPTLRIYKDHPKSQIIGHVDTLIQTRNKSKEMEEQSFIATIHQKTNPALLQFFLFSCFLSQSLVDCPKRVRPIGTKWVLKNKKDERGIVIRNKARLVAQGHTHEEGINYDEVFAPVARIEAIRVFLTYASFMEFTVYQTDVKSVFLYGTIDEEGYVMQPPGFQVPEFP